MNSNQAAVKRFKNRFAARIGSGTLALGMLWGCVGNGLAQELNNSSIPKEVEQVTVDQKQGESIPLDIPLLDSDGRAAKTGDFFDARRPVLLTLNYSDCPILCNVQLNALVDGLDKVGLRLGQDFQILTVSIDPNEPTERIKATKERYIQALQQQPQAAEAWHFCTANEPAIARLADAVGFRYTYDKKSGEYYHPAMLAFVSPTGVISQYSLDVAFPPEQLKLALLDAGNGSIGSPVDQFIMWCFSFDSARGSYVLAAWRLMRLGAATTVGVLLFTLIPYWIGRKRSARLQGTPNVVGQSPA